MSELLHYRFTEGTLAGQSFGNLFLAALNGISPSFDTAVSRMSEVLAIRRRSAAPGSWAGGRRCFLPWLSLPGSYPGGFPKPDTP